MFAESNPFSHEYLVGLTPQHLPKVAPMKQTLRSALLLTLAACTASTHATRPSALGVPSRASALLAVIDVPGTLEVETVTSADWAVDRAGLINLDHPRAREAKLTSGDEPIHVYFHVLRHPTRGTFLIDTGVQRALRDDPAHAVFQGPLVAAMHTDRMKVLTPLAAWLAEEPSPPAGVLFTHLHLDHVSGAPDLPRSTPLHAGPGETSSRAFLHAFTRGTIDRALEGLPPVEAWAFQPDPDGRFAGLLDVFGDGQLWALWTPGHTPGSTAYLARTPHGPVLFTGDTSHTAWGWEHDVEPGTYTQDHQANLQSLAVLRALVREHPAIEVRLGHQALSAQ
jgi:N-acyl homoserine lactone hydrolase